MMRNHEPRLAVSDITAARDFYKRLGRASMAVKLMGMVCAIDVLAPSILGGGLSQIATRAAITGLLILCGVWLSRGIQAEDPAAVRIVAAWTTAWVLLSSVSVIPIAIVGYDHLDLITLLYIALHILPVYFIGTFLILRRSYLKLVARLVDERALPRFWPDLGRESARRRPVLLKKSRLWPYLYFLVIPIPLLVFVWSGLWGGGAAERAPDTIALLGNLTGGAPFIALGVYLAGRLYRQARRSALLSAVELREKYPQPTVLYLRSFSDDKLKMWARAANGRSILERMIRISFEEVIADHLWRYGPVVSIGNPDETSLPLGAARDYATSDGWQRAAEEMMTSAIMIVLVVGRTSGLAWELDTIIKRGLMQKLVVLFPPLASHGANGRTAELPARWGALCAQATSAGMVLPRELDFGCGSSAVR